MSFNWFSLDYIYYPVSGIMWLWYKLFAFILGLIPGVDGETSFFSWALSVMFLVFTLRAILFKPFVRQIETTRQMQELQPQIKELQKKYGKDRQRMAMEMQKLQRENGFNPILGCLPMLAQLPVFLGLYHVLMSFNRTQTGFGRLGLSVQENASLGNYFFSAADVRHFLDANLFGAPLGASMIQTVGLDAFTEFNRMAVIAVGVPLMILAGIATFFNSKASIARQTPEAAANPQTAMMNRLMLYVFPLGVVVGGPFLPLAIILYWVSNNIWTYGQQHVVFGRIERREEEERKAEIERRSSNAPAPGAKPKRNAKKGTADVNGAAVVDDSPTVGTPSKKAKGSSPRTAAPVADEGSGGLADAVGDRGVYISYRKGDVDRGASLIADRLAKRFGDERVIVDVDGAAPPEDAASFEQTLDRSAVVLVVIGEKWLNGRGDDGKRRIDDPDDVIHREIETALGRDDVRVIPIVVGKAKMPLERELPGPLRRMREHTAYRIGLGRLDSDIKRVVAELESMKLTR